MNAKAPVILAVIAGSPIDLSSEINIRSNNTDALDAILYMSYPGQAGGKALAHVIYGLYNPSGRLVTTMYLDSYLDQVDLGDMRMRPAVDLGSDGNYSYPGRTYRFYPDQVVFPFGYGLSFTSWDYTVSAEPICYESELPPPTPTSQIAKLFVQVTNKGLMDGFHSVLLFYMSPNAGKKGEPIKSLVGFDKVFVASGAERCVELDIKILNISQYPGEHIFLVGPTLDYKLSVNVK